MYAVVSGEKSRSLVKRDESVLSPTSSPSSDETIKPLLVSCKIVIAFRYLHNATA